MTATYLVVHRTRAGDHHRHAADTRRTGYTRYTRDANPRAVSPQGRHSAKRSIPNPGPNPSASRTRPLLTSDTDANTNSNRTGRKARLHVRGGRRLALGRMHLLSLPLVLLQLLL
jgi:hypothetical protein